MATGGSILGEIGVILDTRRTALCRAQNYCVVSRLSKNRYRHYSKQDPNFCKVIKGHLTNYKDNYTLNLK